MISSLFRGTKILDFLAERGPLTFEEIIDFTNFPQTSVFRLLKTLEELEYVQRKHNNNGTYSWSLGLKLLVLSSLKLSQLDVRFEVRDLLEDLAKVTDKIVQLGILYNDRVLFLEVIQKSNLLITHEGVGSQLPINTCAAGLILAAFLKEKDLEKILKTQILSKNTPKTPTNPSELRKILKKIRQQGFSVDDEYYALGHRCIGAPLLNHKHQAVAAINISGSISSINEKTMPVLIEHVVNYAAKASVRIGCRCREQETNGD